MNPFNESDNKAARHYVNAAAKHRLGSTGEFLNATGVVMAVCSFEAGAAHVRSEYDELANALGYESALEALRNIKVQEEVTDE